MAQDGKDDFNEEKAIENKATKITVKGLEIDINQNAFQFDYFELLEQLYLIKEDETLTDDEKQSKIQEVMKRYVG